MQEVSSKNLLNDWTHRVFPLHGWKVAEVAEARTDCCRTLVACWHQLMCEVMVAI
jgi:hypothetical protein